MPLHFDFQRADAVLLRLATGVFSGHRRRIGRRLAAALETHGARRRPGNRVALRIGDGDHGVVERGVHVRDARGDVLALAAPNALRFACHRSEETTSELQYLMRTSYSVVCSNNKNTTV